MKIGIVPPVNQKSPNSQSEFGLFNANLLLYRFSFFFAFFTNFAAFFFPFAKLFLADELAFLNDFLAFAAAFLAFFTVRFALRRTILSSPRTTATALFAVATTFPKVLPTVSPIFISASLPGVGSLVVSSVISFSLLFFEARASYAQLHFAAIPSFRRAVAVTRELSSAKIRRSPCCRRFGLRLRRHAYLRRRFL